MKRCFVISPIGSEGSEIREHANDVYDYIIKPAMEECGIQAFRSDHLLEPGKITEQMFREIVADDLCLALLTGHNPNVFYELAIAHAAAKPVIVLMQKGETLPFDIKDVRCVSYDLKPRALFDKVYVREIVSHVQSLEQAGWKVRIPFGDYSPLGGTREREEQLRFFDQSNAYGSAEVWLKLVQQTRRVFDIVGVHLGVWRDGKGFTALLTEKARSDCQVRVLLMHPDNPSLSQIFNPKIPEADSLASTILEIGELFQYYSQLANNNTNISVRQLRQGILHCQLTITDDYGCYIPYLYGRRRRHCPLWLCSADSSLYQALTEEFETLWYTNEPEPEGVVARA